MPSSPPRLVLVTDRHGAAVVEAALDSGLPAVQLRDKELPGRALLALAEAVGADGVQLGTGSMPVDVARRLLPAGTLIGVSTHAPGEASAGADFALFGPVWATPSKTGAQGEDRLREAVRAAAIPVLAIGGVTAERIAAARAAGAAGVAVIRAILAAPDPRTATRALLAALD